MELLLFLVAAALLLSGGCGAAALLLRGRSAVALGELAALAVLLGSLAVTVTLWAVALAATWRWAVGAATGVCLVLAGLGAALWARRRPQLVGVRLFCLAVVPLTGAVGWIAATTPLGWDGLYIWELKAQAIVVEGGLPDDYLHDDSRGWSHPVYPLLVPLFRAWFYTWMGAPHEAFGKLAAVLFFLAAAGLLAGLAPRLGTVTAALSLALLALTPAAIVGLGSAASGYADFPLAVSYLGVLLYVFLSLDAPEAGDLAVAGWLAAALPWTKQEGTVLLAVALGLALLAYHRSGWRMLVVLAGPGAALLAAWRTFVRLEGVETTQVFLQPTLDALRDRLHLWDEVVTVMARLTFDPGAWSLLWFLFPAALLIRPRAHRPWQTLYLALAVVLPLALFSVSYLFSLWSPVTLHVESSFQRLLLQLALPAIVLIAWKTAALLPAARPAPPGDAPPRPPGPAAIMGR
jgi:hypothetical protein